VISRGTYGVLGAEGNCWPQMAGMVPDLEDEQFDWEGDFPPGLHQKDLVIYEMHIRGFTRHTSSKVEHPGTYLGLVEKLSHLKVHFLLQSSSLVMDDVVILTMSNSLLLHVSNL
jgi:isoamylase